MEIQKDLSPKDILKEIQKNLLEAEKNAFQQKLARKKHNELELRKTKKVKYQEEMELLSNIYNERNEIIKSIPKFWLTAFLSHYALGILLTQEDQKIFKFLKSVDVKDTEVGTGIPGYTITLSFEENPYFENTTLTKKIVYTSRGVDVRGSDIKWKKVNPTGNQQESVVENGKEGGCTDGEISFFTLFFDHDDDSRGIREEVAMLIVEDLWPNAITYFVNGNLANEEECATVEGFRSYLS